MPSENRKVMSGSKDDVEAAAAPTEEKQKLPAPRSRVLGAIAGLFALYVAHDALQEQAFRTPGFRFGWFMTFVEIAVCSAFARLFEWGEPPKNLSEQDLATVYKCLAGLALALAASQGTGSAALNYVHFPVKVAFKSSKLVPAMVFGKCLVRKGFKLAEYAAALCMCAALAGLSLADYKASSRAEAANLPLGCGLLSVAVFSDALIPNLQEKVLRELKYPVGRMIVASNAACALLVLAYCALAAELFPALAWCVANQRAAALLVLQALCSYCGLRCYLVVVREWSGVAGVVVTSARKVLTLVLSFALFEKPFTAGHGAAFGLLAAGVALATCAKAKR